MRHLARNARSLTLSLRASIRIFSNGDMSDSLKTAKHIICNPSLLTHTQPQLYHEPLASGTSNADGADDSRPPFRDALLASAAIWGWPSKHKTKIGDSAELMG
jgi:hypothetical protein